MLRIAVQSKGRLFDDTMNLLAEADIKVSASKRTLLVQASNFPLEVLYLRDDDIPQSVASGVADIGIVGENEFVERGENAQIIDRLGFSKCRLSLAIPKKIDYTGLKWFDGKKIAWNMDEQKHQILNEMLFRFEAVRSAQDKKYVMMNAPKAKVEEITQVLPGIKSPTIIPLADEEWCSIHTVLDEKRFWEIIGKLKELGAQGILVTPIEKMIL